MRILRIKDFFVKMDLAKKRLTDESISESLGICF